MLCYWLQNVLINILATEPFIILKIIIKILIY